MQEREQMIRERAYRIWIDQGQPEGKDQEHWMLARQEIEQESAPAPRKRAPTAEKSTRQRKSKN